MSTGPFFMCLFFLRLLFFPLAAIISFLYCFYDLTGLLECVIHRAVVLNDEIAVSLEKFHSMLRRKTLFCKLRRNAVPFGYPFKPYAKVCHNAYDNTAKLIRTCFKKGRCVKKNKLALCGVYLFVNKLVYCLLYTSDAADD